MKSNPQRDWYEDARRNHPAAFGNATKFTRTGEHDTKRYGGPGTRSKNPVRYDRIGEQRAENNR